MKLRFHSVYRISIYLMLFLSTLILSIDAGDYNQFAWIYPVLVAMAGMTAFWTVDRNPKLGLPRELANVLALGSFLLAMIEYWSNPDSLILAMGHWLVYLQFVKMFLPKTSEDDWFLFLLALAQVLVGTFLSRSDWMGVILFAYAVVCLWNLSLFHLKRELKEENPTAWARIEPSPDRDQPYTGLFNRCFFLSSVVVGISTLGLGSLIFLLLPRWAESRTGQSPGSATRHLTGFSDQVRLGQRGEILENDSLVMTVEVVDENNNAVGPGEELLFRGVTLVDYENGKWTRGPVLESDVSRTESLERIPETSLLKQKISLESTDSDALFSLRSVIGASSRRSDEIQINLFDGNLIKQSSMRRGSDGTGRTGQRGAFNYEVISSPAKFARIRSAEQQPGPELLAGLLKVQPLLLQRLKQLSQSMLNNGVNEGAEERAKRLEHALRDSNEYSYTLTMSRTEPDQDPVLDFLEKYKRGHCEYFASGLTLLLRAEGIPARLVNGFKGGEWNPLVQAYSFREKHAHSWVEALIVDVNTGQSNWIVLDPTPGTERAAVVAQLGRFPWQFRTIGDAARYIWTFYVAGFDADRQNRYIYQPLLAVALGILGLLKSVWIQLTGPIVILFHFRTPGDFFSIRGFLASVSLMLLAVALFRAMLAIRNRWKQRHDGLSDSTGLIPELALFERLLELLAVTGLTYKPVETPREFADRARVLLEASTEPASELAVIPNNIVDALYRVRFGKYPLPPETADSLSAQLDQLQSRLNVTLNRPDS